MSLSVAHQYLKYALEKENDRTAWDLWRVLYRDMVLDRVEFRSFAAFKREIFGHRSPQSTNKSPAEIEEEMLKVVAAYEGR